MHFFLRLLVELFVSLSTFCTILELKDRFLEHFVDKKRVTECTCKFNGIISQVCFRGKGLDTGGKQKILFG